jgi:hypothetical protein
MNHEASGSRPGATRAAWIAGAAAMLAAQSQAQTPSLGDANAPAAGAQQVVAAEWKQQKVDFPFSAFTAYYTCTGLEDKIRFILLRFGARPDLKVRAYSCDRAENRPNKSAWVSVEFSSLVPASDPSTPGAVKGSWKDVRLAPNRPYEMGMGECELVEQMASMVKKGFTLRNVSYNTTCVPKQVSVGDYSVSAQSLQPATALQVAAH